MYNEIYDYFDHTYNNSELLAQDSILKFGVIYEDVSTTFLDAFVNSVDKHICCYTLDYYRNNDKEKVELVNNINNPLTENEFHTKFHKIEDDIVILSKIGIQSYIFFWYHLSGKCDIGRFKSSNNVEIIEGDLKNWFNSMVNDETITGYSKLDINQYFNGYISF